MPIALLARRTIAALGSGAVAVLSLGAQSAGAANGPRATVQSFGGTALIFAVHAVSDQVVWASGTGGTVLRTTNGGEDWVARPVPGGDQLQFRDIHAFGPDTAFVLSIGSGAASRIYRTINGGTSWDEQFRNTDSLAFYDCFTFLDPQRAVVFGDATRGRTHILRTTNGGADWALLPESAVPAPLDGEGAYAASGRCVEHAGERVFVATGGPGSRLFVSDDAGATFAVLPTPFVRSASSGTSGLAFRDPDHGIGVAGDMTNLQGDSAQAVVAVTGDGGRSWELRARPPLPGALTGVTWVPDAGPETVVAAGFGGVFSSPDGGRSWRVQSDAAHAGLDAIGRTAFIGGRGQILRLVW